MSVKESSTRLTAAICPHGVSFRPHWFINLGVAEYHGKQDDHIVVYATDVKQARKFFQKQGCGEGDFVWEGYRVLVHRSGHPRLLSDVAT